MIRFLLRTETPVSVCTLACLALLLTAIPSHAQRPDTGTVVATVTDADSGDPIPGVNVLVDGTPLGAATGPDGRATLPSVPAGTQTIVARSVGYATGRTDVEVLAGQTTRVAFSLRSSPVEMRGVEVTALGPDLQPTQQLADRQIREADAADTGGLLRGLPGIDAVRRGPLGFDPNVRGLTGTEVGVYVDGMRTFPAGPLRMDSQLSHFDPSSVQSVEVVKGPYALTWGPGNLSAIRVDKRGDDPPPRLATGSVTAGYDTNTQGVETSGFVMGRDGRVSYAVSGAWRRGDDYTAGDGAEVAGGYTTGEGRGRLGIRLSPTTSLDVSGGYQEQRDIDYPGRLLNASFFKTGTGQLRLTVEPNGSPLQTLTVSAHAQQTLHEMDNRGKPTFDAGTFPNGNSRPPLRIGVHAEIQNFGGRVEAEVSPSSAWTMKVGGDVLYTYRDAVRPLQIVRPDGSPVTPPFYDSEQVWPGVTIVQEGGFVNLERTLGSVRLAATGRIDFAQSDAERPSSVFLENTGASASDLDQNDAMLSGALTASLPLSDRWTLSVGGGSVARPPTALERYADRFPATKAQTSAEFQGNPFLEPERSNQADLWLAGGTRTWTVRLSGFARRITNYVTLQPTSISPLLPLSPETVFHYVNGDATFVGAEASGQWAVADPVTVRASGSWLWGRDDRLDEPALGVAPLQGRLGARWRLPVSGQSLSRLYLDGTLRAVARQDRVAETRGETATDGYATVALTAGARFWRRLELEAGVENLFDVTVANHLNANNPFRGVRVPEPGRVVSLDLTVDF